MKSFKPYTPSRRFITVEDFSGLTKKEPEKSLMRGLRKKSGRNNFGLLVVRHQGGGHKRSNTTPTAVPVSRSSITPMAKSATFCSQKDLKSGIPCRQGRSPIFIWAMLYRLTGFRKERCSIISNSCPVPAGSSFVPPEPRHSSWPRKGVSLKCVCLRVKFVSSIASVWPPLVKSEISITKT
jgi:hypothetical protein